MNPKDIITLSKGKAVEKVSHSFLSNFYPIVQFYNNFYNFDNLYKCNPMYKSAERQSS